MTEKILLDSSAYEEIDLSIIPKEFGLYSTAIEQEEILDISESHKKKKLIDKYEKAHNAEIPKCRYYKYYPDDMDGKWLNSDKELLLERFVFGAPNLGCAKLGKSGYYQKILNYMKEKRPDKNHINDALIGEVAILNKLLLISKDELLREAVIHFGGKAESLSEFNKRLKQQ